MASELNATEEPAEPEGRDLSGRDRIVRNILSSWGGQLVFVVAGFVMPRMIDRRLGQVSLGIWDFGWSIVSYLSVAQVGIGDSVARYVARHRSANDIASLRRTVSSGMLVQFSVGIVLALVSVVLAVLVPSLVGGKLGAHAEETRWLVGLLGTSLAIQIGCDAFHGVLSGCHRWDVHNAVSSGGYAVTVLAMLTALLLGGGLPSLALAYLIGSAAGEVARATAALRVCPEAHVDWSRVDRKEVRRLIRFGGKTTLASLAVLVLRNANAMVIGLYLGPGMLAVYSRADALVRNVEVFLNKAAFVFTPVVSSLQSAKRHDEIRLLLVEGTRYAAGLTLPPLLGLIFLGDPILRLWLGPHYESGVVLVLVAGGSLLPLANRPGTRVLIGMNMHGRLVQAAAVGAIFGAIFSLVCVGVLDWGLPGAALAVASTNTVFNGLFVTWYACRRLVMSPFEYVARAWSRALACNVPFAACLLASRMLLGERPVAALLAGAVAGALVLAPLYWFFLFPPGAREAVRAWLRSALGRLGPSRA